MTEQKRSPLGSAQYPAPSWDTLAAQDSRAIPAVLREDTYSYLGSEALATERYTSPEFFQREIDKMWPNVWQFAARDEELPQEGDLVVYENAGRSYLLIRQHDGAVRAFHNVCLHRGRKLRTQNGRVKDLVCPFHGFTWKRDGALKEIPCRWDFEHLKDGNMRLPEASVGRWGGYIFVRENDTGPTLEEYLAPLPEHFKLWPHEDCYTRAWVGKVIPANWKVTAEAFMEAWHSNNTHPQIRAFTGDVNTKYNIYGDHINVAITPFGVPSPELDMTDRDQRWVLDQYLKYNGRVGGPGVKIDLPEGATARSAMGEFNRKRFGKDFGRDMNAVSDAELQDALTYNVFPNFSPWGGFTPNVVYRWRPWPDVGHTLMEVRLLQRLAPGQPAPPSPAMNLLGADQPWSAAKELSVLGDVLQQDMNNLPYVQEGLRASKTGAVNLANYQEIRIRHFHQTLDKYLAR
ncbi:MAG: aromatic ring-hydroxylating dioxygenase subunit alpha [Rhodospirillaceae bacterium]|nr:MAG: aromatic ring-hydroxylating dioxygenase subunit alpha [Rhodospirillaceae bacterium]